jgi:exopolyphosphatase / guanosine-5'-triphosphate,3'-diphosphate pyrophosphatase
MTIASIDIGTNTVLLLIAEVDSSTRKIISLRDEYRMPRIGQGTKKSGLISLERLSLLYEVLNKYKSIINRYNCNTVLLTGTNAFRMAQNTPEIKDELKKIFNFDLNVITGEDEAEYAYFGTISNLDDRSFSMVIDIGGSSTEIIYGEGLNVIFKKSLQLGSVSATEHYIKSVPPTLIELENLSTEIKRLFTSFDKTIIPKKVIAIAGTATTLACMNLGLKEFEESKIDKSSITIQNMINIIGELSSLTVSEILDRYGPVMKGREDIILAGAFILYQFMEYFGIDNIIVSTRGIRYGAIVKYLDSSIKD